MQHKKIALNSTQMAAVRGGEPVTAMFIATIIIASLILGISGS